MLDINKRAKQNPYGSIMDFLCLSLLKILVPVAGTVTRFMSAPAPWVW
jgi:hypothetical protein